MKVNPIENGEITDYWICALCKGRTKWEAFQHQNLNDNELFGWVHRIDGIEIMNWNFSILLENFGFVVSVSKKFYGERKF
jgi:hypothetical protein